MGLLKRIKQAQARRALEEPFTTQGRDGERSETKVAHTGGVYHPTNPDFARMAEAAGLNVVKEAATTEP